MASIATVAAGALATAAYLDAKFHVRNDFSQNTVAGSKKAAEKFLLERVEQKKLLMYHVFEEQAATRPNSLFLLFEGRSWSYRQFFDDIQRVGNYLRKSLGIRPKELVALNGGNSPEYLLMWFGLDAIGACPAFINFNLEGKSLVHSIKLAKARYILADSDLHHRVEQCQKDFKSSGIETIYYNRAFVDSLQDRTPTPEEPRQEVGPFDVRSLIYTSGTTGLPKGTIMLTGREINTGNGIKNYLNLQPGDRFYTCLPLYHGAAHGLCVTPSVFAGCTVILSRKFSHRTFWPEVRETKSNIIQYVGELCRYLVNAPPSPLDKVHNVEVAWGNGMRPDVWEKFRQRFGIPVINELYAATDGLGSSFNANRGEFSRNAIGVRGTLWHVMNGGNEYRVRIDPDTEDLLKDENGFAIKCGTNEPGEVVYQMDPATQAQAFAGYFDNTESTEKRKVHNMFKKGDLWFRSGDMMRLDQAGRLFFVDRLGDTFRWKSENVSTSELADVIGEYPTIDECTTYGVLVPNADGRAGAAAIVFSPGTTTSNFAFADFAKFMLERLPRYAVPIFLRITEQIATTGTMKQQKGPLKREGIDPEKVDEKMYWLPPNGAEYVPYGKNEWEKLKSGEVKL